MRMIFRDTKGRMGALFLIALFMLSPKANATPKRAAGDFSALTVAISEAKKYIEENTAAHTAAAIVICQDEISKAQDLVDEGNASQTTINSEKKSLTAALAALKATAGLDYDVANIIEGYDTERGFRHPGGLHTEADFDRIRQQIADGNEKVVSAYNVLKSAEYSQATCATWPVETIVRGGGSGENYINAARGATIAYQNALRWRIDGTVANARHAVDVLMQWAQTTKGIGGDSNYALAAGLYGYQFAQAAELVRDYEGWSANDFATFKRWMLDVWYPQCIGFLRGRNGTWENVGKWGECPGHYWSNWGLCNVMAVMSIGILCDDVFIYNQGLSYFKYDQVGTFKDPRTETPIKNDGLTEFLGNLVVTTQESDLETGAYGKLGQMQESGRDIGHATMAAGLAVDVAQIGWNQGDDLFSYMDNRLAAGLEYVAAQTQSVENLPWTNYHYANNGLAWWDSRAWLQTSPALGEQIRPYWGTVIGHYEGVKGVKMPFSEVAYEKMGVDGGGTGGTSGGYDHLGYTVLTHTRDMATAEQVPTPLTPVIEYDGKTIEHNELGGLYHTYKTAATTALPAGTTVTLKPQLPAGTTDTGLWEWNSGEKTKDITIVADKSGVWRATYTNANGVKSEQVFTIAVAGDCMGNTVSPYITVGDGEKVATDTVEVFYGSSVTLGIDGITGWGTFLWENGATTSTITMPYVTTSRDISGIFINQGGRKHVAKFHVDVIKSRPDIVVNGRTYSDTLSVLVMQGDTVTLKATTPKYPIGGTFLWSDGSTSDSLSFEDIQTSGTYTVEYTLDGDVTAYSFRVLVEENDYRTYPVGDYYVVCDAMGTYMTNMGGGEKLSFKEKDETNPKSQQWRIENEASTNVHSFMSLLDSCYVTITGKLSATAAKRFLFKGLAGLDDVAIRRKATTGNCYWGVADDGTVNFAAYKTPTSFPFTLVPIESSGIGAVVVRDGDIVLSECYSAGGVRLANPCRGVNIRKVVFANGQTRIDKIVVR